MFDSIYIFHFSKELKEEALIRLRKSIRSVNQEEFRIGILNCSDYCIRNEVPKNLQYAHLPREGVYNRSFMINEAVRRFVNEQYFNISDIDIMYPPTFGLAVRSLLKQFENETCRIVYYNNNMGVGDFKTYDECHENYSKCQDHLRSKRGPAGGLGIVHTESFWKIGGFEERFIGYGPEDQEFNLRISRINKLLKLDNELINTYHLWHNNFTPKKNFRDNLRIFSYLKNQFNKIKDKEIIAGSIPIPPIVYHQESERVKEIDL